MFSRATEYTEVLSSIQRLMRGTLQKRRCLNLTVNLTHKAAVCVQSRIRQFLARKMVDSMRRSSVDVVGDEDDDLDSMDTSREDMLAIFDSKEENDEEEDGSGHDDDETSTSEVSETKQEEKKKKTAKKKHGTTYSRGTFFGTYRRSEGGTLHLTTNVRSGRQESIEEDEEEFVEGY